MYTEEDLRKKLLKKFGFLNLPCEKLCGLNESNLDSYLKDDSLSEYSTVYNNFLYQRNYKKQEDRINLI